MKSAFTKTQTAPARTDLQKYWDEIVTFYFVLNIKERVYLDKPIGLRQGLTATESKLLGQYNSLKRKGLEEKEIRAIIGGRVYAALMEVRFRLVSETSQ